MSRWTLLTNGALFMQGEAIMGLAGRAKMLIVYNSRRWVYRLAEGHLRYASHFDGSNQGAVVEYS